MALALRLHQDSVCFAVTRIEVDVARADGTLSFSFSVSGKIDGLLMPPPTKAARADELWRRTCFEAFIRASPIASYYEFNFSPSTQWAAYRFDAYRSGMRNVTDIAAPRITVQSAPDRYTLQAALAFLPSLSSSASARASGRTAWRLGLSAVIEEKNGNKSYWALAHPPGKPDFHHADCFALELSAG
jgi:hypothetical protein